MKKIIFFFFVLLNLLAINVIDSLAINCQRPNSVVDEFENSDVVFVGKVIDIEESFNEPFSPFIFKRAKFDVTKPIKDVSKKNGFCRKR